MRLTKLPLLFLIISLALLGDSAFAQCPAITSQPTDKTVCAGTTTTFSVTATNSPNYQWQEYNGSSWSNISGSPYTGFNTATLTIIGSPSSFDQYKYRCVLTSTCPTVTSDVALLTINLPAYVIAEPEDSIVCAGKNATFEVEAGGANLAYQWEVNNGSGWTNLANNPPYSGVTTNKLLLTGPSVSLSGNFYRVTINGGCPPSTTSDSGKLTVHSVPLVTAEPSDVADCIGADVVFSTAGTGTGVGFQWQEDQGSGFVDLPGALPYDGVYTNLLKINDITAAFHNRKYRCVVFGTCSPADTTKAVTLTVQTPPSFSSISNVDPLCEGENADITVVASGTNLKYTWLENKNDGNGWTTLADGGVYSGTKTATLKLSGTPSSFNGYQYYSRIEGTCSPQTTSTVVGISVTQDKSIGEHPRDTTVIIGENAIFNVKAVGTGLNLHWQEDNGKGFQSISPTSPYYSGVNTVKLTIKDVDMSKSGYRYRCLASGGCDPAPAASNDALLNVWWPASVNNLYSDKNIVIYPNPATGAELTIRVNNLSSDNVDTKVVDQFGRVLISQNIALNNNTGTLDISKLPSGIYSIFIADGQFNMVRNMKFTKL